MYHRKRLLFLIAITLLMASPILLSFSEKLVSIEQSYNFSADTPFARGPIISKVTNDSLVIFWRTDVATDAEVEYGLSDSNLDQSTVNSTLDTDHRILLSGLDPDTKYYYRVTSDSLESEIYHFRTAPLTMDTFKLAVIGDNRPDTGDEPVQPTVFKTLMDMIILEEPHLVIMTGDFVYRVNNELESDLLAWEYLTNVTDKLGHYAPILTVIGNHDTGAHTGTIRAQYYLDAFELYNEPSLYYSFDYAGAHFTCLNSEEYGLEGRITGDQYDWLVSDLESTSQPLKIVVAHRPLYPCNHIGSSMDVNEAERDALQQLFEENNVTLFLAGHDHLFNRINVNGVVHFIIGGGGAPAYTTPWGGDYNHYFVANVSPREIESEVIKPNGEIANEYRLPYDGPIEIEIRGFGNRSIKPAGSMPEVYFSEPPVTTYYSWDGGSNSTTLTGLPDVSGSHTLDIFAEDDLGVWGHEVFVFTRTGSEPTTTTTTSSPMPVDLGLGQILLFAGAGIGVVIIVLVIVKLRTK